MPISDSETIKGAVERNRHPELTLAHELLPGICKETVYRPVAYADVLYGLSTGNVYSSSRFRYATGLPGGAAVERGRSQRRSSIGASKMRGCLLPAFILPYLILSDRHAISGSSGLLAPLPLLVIHGDADDTRIIR